MSRHRSFRTTAAASGLSAALLVGLPAITSSQAPTARAAASHTHRFRGTVRHTSRRHHWFSMRTSTHHTVRVHTASGTWWDDCDWGAMRYGTTWMCEPTATTTCGWPPACTIGRTTAT